MKYKKAIPALLAAFFLFALQPQGVLASLVQTGQPGSITIHSLAVDDTTDYQSPGTGEAAESVEGEPLPNVSFTVTRVNDGATTAQDAVALTGDDAYSSTKTTDEEYGQAVFGDLAQGVYLVHQEETLHVVQTIEDFLVEVPMTAPSGTRWIYDVHVYPKYQLLGAPDLNAYITEPGNQYDSVNLNSPVTWIAASKIPADVSGAKSMEIQGTLNDSLSYIEGTVDAYVQGEIAGRNVLALEDDYTVERDGNVLAISLSQAGLTKLGNAVNDITAVFYVEYGTVLDIAKANLGGMLAKEIGVETSLLYTNSIGRPYTATVTEDKPYVYTGGLNIIKLSGAQPLAGASYKIYRTMDDAKAGENAIQTPGGTGDWTETTDEEGIATFAGIAYGGKGIAPNQSKTNYYLVQTQAPAGYNLLRAPVEIAVDAGSHLPENEVVIQARSGFLLPATGGAGTVWFTVIGLLLIALAVYLYLRSRRKRTKDEPSA